MELSLQETCSIPHREGLFGVERSPDQFYQGLRNLASGILKPIRRLTEASKRWRWGTRAG
jgi:hypothetical protein